jgi:hypothetical protein
MRLARPAWLPGSAQRPNRSARQDVGGTPDAAALIRRRDPGLVHPVPPRNRHLRVDVLKGELEVVEIAPVPGEKQLVVVLADSQWNPMPSGEELVPAVVMPVKRRLDRLPETSHLVARQLRDALADLQGRLSFARPSVNLEGHFGRRDPSFALPLRTPRRGPAARPDLARDTCIKAKPPAVAATGAMLSAISSMGMPAMWATSKTVVRAYPHPSASTTARL